jgi:hypothetical protein
VKTHIETRLWTDVRYKNLSRLMADEDLHNFDIARYAAIGMLVHLWQEAQKRLATHMTMEDIDEALHPGATEILFRCGFLDVDNETGTFRIKGNAARIAQLRKFKATVARAGRLSASKRWGTVYLDIGNDEKNG